MEKTVEHILRKRMHGLYLSRTCADITQLSHALLGLHCWFHRNVAFSALIRGAGLAGWKTALTKTWLYRGTLHGVLFEDLPLLLALHAKEDAFAWLLGKEREAQAEEIAERILHLMEDGVCSRTELRHIFAYEYEPQVIEQIFSSWGGIFICLARLGKVAFRNMTSRDFDLIGAEPVLRPDEVLPELLHRYFAVYGPATLADAAWFFGLSKEARKNLSALDLEAFERLEYEGNTYYSVDDGDDIGDIPEMTLLSGFDPLIVSYTERSAVLPAEYKSAVILKSGICNPTIAVNGQVAGIWNIKKNESIVNFFAPQPKRIQEAAFERIEDIRRLSAGNL